MCFGSRKKGLFRVLPLFLAAAWLGGCGGVWNSPYPERDRGRNILYSAFSERPKHLDPAQSYSENEAIFTAQIYEPPLQYHYFKRPYTLVPATAEEVPRPQLFDASGRRLPDDAPDAEVAYSLYEIRVRPGIYYQPHPALARDSEGRLLYHHLQPDDLSAVRRLSDFKEQGTRELVAADYVYQIKRLAHPRLNCPIFGLMADYIVGLKEFARVLKKGRPGAGPGRAGQGLSGSQPIFPGRGPGQGPLHLPNKAQGQIPAVYLLAGHVFFRTDPGRGGTILFPTRHGGKKSELGLVSPGYRPLHVDQK